MMVLYYLFIVGFLCVCALLSIVILMQEAKSSGLGASFGGDSGESLFGTSTPEVLKKFTAYLIAIFLGSCILLSFWTASLSRSKESSPSQERVEK